MKNNLKIPAQSIANIVILVAILKYTETICFEEHDLIDFILFILDLWPIYPVKVFMLTVSFSQGWAIDLLLAIKL